MNAIVKPLNSIPRRRLGSYLYDVLMERIAGYRFLSGKKLDLEEIATELDVSRPPLWEAVCRLEQEGFVLIRPNRGVFIATLSWAEAAELYQVRAHMEGLAAKLCIANITPASIVFMEGLLEEHQSLIHDGDWQRFNPMDHKFHSVLYDACGNNALKDMLLRIKIKLGMLDLDINPLLPALYDQHLALLQALKKQDADLAVQSITEHDFFMQRHCLSLIGSTQGA